ncbi:MAG: hypothetical protein FJ280_08400 [Planctomycetes bacterium]|nr:hypothetical protein [Planctomycetota bacterium]
MISTFDSLLILPPETTLAAVWLGVSASANVCALVRLPILTAYVLSTGTTKRRALVLAAVLTAGIVAGTVLLGVMATPLADGTHKTLQVSKYSFWVLGACLIVLGVLLSGLIDSQLVPQKWRRLSARLIHTDMPGALLLGLVLGLLLTPACPMCRAGLLAVTEAGAGGTPSGSGILLPIGFALGQGLIALCIGVLAGLLRPGVFGWLRTRMCSIEQRTQLLTGNLLVVLGIYFVLVG